MEKQQLTEFQLMAERLISQYPKIVRTSTRDEAEAIRIQAAQLLKEYAEDTEFHRLIKISGTNPVIVLKSAITYYHSKLSLRESLESSPENPQV